MVLTLSAPLGQSRGDTIGQSRPTAVSPDFLGAGGLYRLGNIPVPQCWELQRLTRNCSYRGLVEEQVIIFQFSRILTPA